MPKTKTKTKRSKQLSVRAAGHMTVMVALERIPTPGTPLAPQLRTILDVLRDVQGSQQCVPRMVFVERLADVLQTRQPAGRVLSFYRDQLVEGGYMRIFKAVPPATPAEQDAAPLEGQMPPVEATPAGQPTTP